MRTLPLAFLLTAALLLAGCASNDADESRNGAGDGGGASEVSGQVTVVGGGNQTAQGNQTAGAGSGNVTSSG